MSASQILLAIFSISVISTILTSFFNWKIHNSNYKKDSYKNLFYKTIDAYEDLNIVANLMYDLVDTKIGIVH